MDCTAPDSANDAHLISLLLDSAGRPQDVATSLDGLEGHFSDRLDTMAALVADRVNLYTSSWEDLRATVTAVLEEDAFTTRDNVCLADVLKYAAENYCPAPEQSKKR